ncbi:MAG: endonuclease/exonuclease/phosphatase family protein [Pseudomonadota bacterium]|nr:endonuclease/exonuclease/phosphatase family protein [Pseudomonadota bacterium]
MLRIATFNTGLARLRLLGRPVFDAVPFPDLRLPLIRDRLASGTDGVDIWLLQEVYGADAVRAFTAIPGYAAVSALSLGRDSGLVTLVRDGLAVSDAEIAPFPANDWVEATFAKKGTLAVDVETPVGPMRIGNLHTSYDGRGRKRIKAKAPLSRARQVGIALDLLERGGAGRHLLLGGDVNASKAHEPATWRVAPDRGYADLRLEAEAYDDAGVTSWAPANRLARGHGRNEDIDLIFARWHGAPLRCSARHFLTEPVVPLPDGTTGPLSDHYALLVEIAACQAVVAPG